MARRATRRAFAAGVAAGVAAALAGCVGGPGDGDDGTPTPAPDNPAYGDATGTGELTLTSPAFEDGAPIPERYGRDAENVNPPLRVSGVPDGAESMTLIVDDPDAVEPAGEVWLHWLVWNIDPSRRTIPEGWDPEDAVEGTNDFGSRGYDGPDPPDGTHTYRFKLYAIDATLDLPKSAGKRRVGQAMAGRVLARTQLEGTYPP